MSAKIAMLVQDVGNQLKQIGLTVATAESCTGGGLSFWLTSIPGSSQWLERGFVTYSNTAKIEMLKVPETTIAQFGAVSKEVAIAMAEGALLHSPASIAISITGIAGPGGGTDEKPVGTVWTGLACKSISAQAVLSIFSGNRESVRLQSIVNALEMLRNISQQISKQSK